MVARHLNTPKAAVAILVAALLSLASVVSLAPGANAAPGDGPNGEIQGFYWGPNNNQYNWEGTYRMPDGSEAWCAQIWQPEPLNASPYGGEIPLTKNDGTALSPTEMSQLAYIISEASQQVMGGEGGVEADTYGAATAIIVYD